MKQQSKNHSAGVSIGMVSILMIFVVLCLTTFATLSFVSARADLKLSKKASDSVSEYYAADSTAETYLAQIASQLETADSSWQQTVSLSDTKQRFVFLFCFGQRTKKSYGCSFLPSRFQRNSFW